LSGEKNKEKYKPEMKYLKLFEDKQTESDIAEICKKYNIQNWSINSEGLVDVVGDVNLYMFKLTKLPLSFGYVSGDFDCPDNKLTNLEGCPLVVGGHFNCNDNKLTDLEGCPKSVGGHFYCGYNKITSLRFAPEQVDGIVRVLPNPISDIPKKYLKDVYLQFIIKEKYNWNLYRKDGTIYPERLRQMIDWGKEQGKI
jgi:hypothetical protein